MFMRLTAQWSAAEIVQYKVSDNTWMGPVEISEMPGAFPGPSVYESFPFV